MFSRSILRAAAPVKQAAPHTIRTYATQPPSSGGGLGVAGYGAIGALVAGGGYYYLSSQGKAPPVQKVAAEAAAAATPAAPAPKAFTGGDQGFLSLKLEKTEDINHNTKRLVFALPEADQVSGMPIASALLTKFKGEGMEKAVMRPYTPTSDTDERGFIELVVKKYPNGPMSEHIHSLKPGQTLDIKGPLPKYPVTPNKHDHIAMICGGTGITPMYQVARAILKNPEDRTKVTLVFGNLSEEDILLKRELDEFENTYPQRFRVFHTLDNPPANWKAGKGHITKDLLKTVLPEAKEANIKIFVCGPPGMYKAVAGAKKSPSDQGELDGILKDLGYAKEQVFKF